jgi:hypothetical protein
MSQTTLSAFFRAAPQPTDLPDVANVAWENLIQSAADEMLLPALGQQVRSLGLASSIPEEVMQFLAEAEALNEERNRLIIDEAVNAAKLLNQIGIRPVALKGLAYLFAGTYPKLGCRYLADIDLLVPSSELTRGIAHLLEHGYNESEYDLLGRLRHHYPAIGRPGFPQLEIHDCVGLGACSRILPASQMISEARLFTYDGAEFLLPSLTHLASHLILHTQLAHPYRERIFPPLRSQYDLAQFQARFGLDVDWMAIVAAYRRAGELATLSLHLMQAEHDIGLKIPGPICKVGLFTRIRWRRRLLLNRYPRIRLMDPVYIALSLLSRRLRLVTRILSKPRSWLPLLRRLMEPDFYSRIFNDFQ